MHFLPFAGFSSDGILHEPQRCGQPKSPGSQNFSAVGLVDAR
jgi:hypothetical protein